MPRKQSRVHGRGKQRLQDVLAPDTAPSRKEKASRRAPTENRKSVEHEAQMAPLRSCVVCLPPVCRVLSDLRRSFPPIDPSNLSGSRGSFFRLARLPEGVRAVNQSTVLRQHVLYLVA